MECKELYKLSETARDHATNPRNCGALDNFDGHARITGPCGDTMEFWLSVSDGRIQRVSFTTDGCGPSLACGSLATSLAEGRRLEEAAALGQEDILKALGEFPEEYEHCALLVANTLKAACDDFGKRQAAFQNQPYDARVASDTCGEKNCTASQRGKDESEAQFEERRQLQARLCRIRHKVMVLSGKGGVGKSTVAVNLAVALKNLGKRVGLLDVDIHGPSIPTMLGLEQETIRGGEEGLLPVDLGGMQVMSLGFLLRNQDDAVIWRGPLKMGGIRQFLKDVEWGELDYLVIDSPPGTGDEPLSVCQLIERLDGAVIVTTPQRVAAVDVRKSITFCRQLEVPVLGIVENMSGFVCPKCGEVIHILCSGGGRRIAEDMGVPFLGSIPIDPRIAQACDDGRAFIPLDTTDSLAEVMRSIINPIAALDGTAVPADAMANAKSEENQRMKVAIPLANGKLAMHFGHCEHFALIEVDIAKKEIVHRENIEAPPHQPGLLPPWLAERGAEMIIAGGMGQRALGLFAEQGIRVVIGAAAETPERLVTDYLAGTLQTGENVCDH
jgi:ATP-binding protein involved in chromosome partitioning